jgi:hypothetical protein
LLCPFLVRSHAWLADFWRNVSTKTPLILTKTMSFSSSMQVWINAFGLSMTATSLASSESAMQVSDADSVATVGELASSFEMKSCCLFPQATVWPFVLPSRFSFKNTHDSNTLFFWV